jgi:hypothetical protein
MVPEFSDEDLAALNVLVHLGLADVATTEDGEPFYKLGSRFVLGPAPKPQE